MKTRSFRTFVSLFLAVIGLGVIAAVAIAVGAQAAVERDYIAYWAAGQQLVHGHNPYDSGAIFAIQQQAGLTGARPNLMLNMPNTFFLAAPLGFLSPGMGMIFWFVATLASLMASIRMMWTLNGEPRNRLHLMGYLFAPVLACIMAGQLDTFLLLGVVLFLRYHRSRPTVAGAALLLCAVKPHLFVPFAVVILAWAVYGRRYRLLMGALGALSASCGFAYWLDPQAWSQYAAMMKSTAEIRQDFVPTLSMMFRVAIDRDVAWLLFVPVAAASLWALRYYWMHREEWDWMEHGMLLLLVSEACAPHAWFTDEVVMLPAIMISLYRADRLGRSSLFYGFISAAALLEVMRQVPIVSLGYLWTAPAWFAWYLYATHQRRPAAASETGEARLSETASA